MKTIDSFVGAAKRLDDVDLPKWGHTIGVGEDELHAFMDVEAAGSGFDSKNRLTLLPEPHIFYRLLENSGNKSLLKKAVSQGIAYKKWRTKPYPRSNDAKYELLKRMMLINEEIALQSCSWGLFQIMGFNFKKAGFTSAAEMVAVFLTDEEEHLKAVINFLKASKLDDDLRAHRWNILEDIYNGGGFNGFYAKKLEKSFNKWKKIRDTPWSFDQALNEIKSEAKNGPPVALPPISNKGATLPQKAATPPNAGNGGAIGSLPSHTAQKTKSATIFDRLEVVVIWLMAIFTNAWTFLTSIDWRIAVPSIILGSIILGLLLWLIFRRKT